MIIENLHHIILWSFPIVGYLMGGAATAAVIWSDKSLFHRVLYTSLAMLFWPVLWGIVIWVFFYTKNTDKKGWGYPFDPLE